MKETYYNTRVWLNPEDSPSCGSLVCYDGFYRPDSDELYRNMFVAVTDCYNTARLHKTSDDSIEDYAAKVRLMCDTLDAYYVHLVQVLEAGRAESVNSLNLTDNDS